MMIARAVDPYSAVDLLRREQPPVGGLAAVAQFELGLHLAIEKALDRGEIERRLGSREHTDQFGGRRAVAICPI